MEQFILPALVVLYIAKIPGLTKVTNRHRSYEYRWPMFVLRLVIIFGLSLLVAYCYELVV
jgi:hypothetical protein